MNFLRARISVGVSLNTVRIQLRGVLEKTGCRRQAEAIALLGGIATPRAGSRTLPDTGIQRIGGIFFELHQI